MKPGSGLRILMTTDTVGGVWTYAVILCRGLVMTGCDVALVTLGPPASEAQRAAVGDLNIKLIETDLALEWQDPAGSDRSRAARELSQIARSYCPDITHLNSHREASYSWPSPTLVVSHSCVSSWAEACGQADMLETEPWRSYVAAVRDGLLAASSWAAPTKFFHDKVARLYGIGPGHVIWNGSDVAASSRASKRPIIFSAGRVWDPAKNVQALFAAAPNLDWPVAIAGQTRTAERAESELQASPKVQLLGALVHAETLTWMERAAVFASVARYEPFGLGVLEAARSGCALILSDIGSFRELWDGAALFVSAELAEFADQLNRVCRDSSLRRHLQTSAFRRSHRYSSAAMTAAYLALYERLASSEEAARQFAMSPQPETCA